MAQTNETTFPTALTTDVATSGQDADTNIRPPQMLPRPNKRAREADSEVEDQADDKAHNTSEKSAPKKAKTVHVKVKEYDDFDSPYKTLDEARVGSKNKVTCKPDEGYIPKEFEEIKAHVKGFFDVLVSTESYGGEEVPVNNKAKKGYGVLEGEDYNTRKVSDIAWQLMFSCLKVHEEGSTVYKTVDPGWDDEKKEHMERGGKARLIMTYRWDADANKLVEDKMERVTSYNKMTFPIRYALILQSLEHILIRKDVLDGKINLEHAVIAFPEKALKAKGTNKKTNVRKGTKLDELEKQVHATRKNDKNTEATSQLVNDTDPMATNGPDTAVATDNLENAITSPGNKGPPADLAPAMSQDTQAAQELQLPVSQKRKSQGRAKEQGLALSAKPRGISKKQSNSTPKKQQHKKEASVSRALKELSQTSVAATPADLDATALKHHDDVAPIAGEAKENMPPAASQADETYADVTVAAHIAGDSRDNMRSEGGIHNVLQQPHQSQSAVDDNATPNFGAVSTKPASQSDAVEGGAVTDEAKQFADEYFESGAHRLGEEEVNFDNWIHEDAM